MTAIVEACDAIGDVITQAINTPGQGNLKATADAFATKADQLLENAGEPGP